MKTIKQIADEIGVSKQAVQKRMSREPLCTALRPCLSTIKGTKYIDEIGQHLIITAFAHREETTVHIDVADNLDNHVHSEIIKLLQDNLAVLKGQLAEKDRQIESRDRQITELTAAVRLHAEGVSADRKKELAGTIIDGQRKLIGEKPAKGFFARIFGWKRENPPEPEYAPTVEDVCGAVSCDECPHKDTCDKKENEHGA